MSTGSTQQNSKTPIKNNKQSNLQLESTDNSDESYHCNRCDELQLKVKELEKQVKRLHERNERMRKITKKLPLDFQTEKALNNFFQVLNDVMSAFNEKCQQKSKIDNDIIINYFSTQTQQLKELKEQLNKQDNIQIPELPIALFLGQAAVGKTTLISQMIDDQEMNEFELLQSMDKNYYFVDTPGFDFDDIEIREKQIAQYYNLFDSYGKNIRAIFIVVNFERTDIMKKKVMEIFKYFNKFLNLISIIITQFHLSQDKIADKQHLQERFDHFKVKKLIFMDETNDYSQILNAIAPLSLDVRDTIFEPTNEQEQAEIMNDFLKQYK